MTRGQFLISCAGSVMLGMAVLLYALWITDGAYSPNSVPVISIAVVVPFVIADLLELTNSMKSLLAYGVYSALFFIGFTAYFRAQKRVG
jgi:NhaP-type Na+/H+ or K+/H+ antiporter